MAVSTLIFTFGILGNIVSFMVYLAPLPTFYRVFKRKSTEGFQSLPYVVALFSAMLWMYYGLLKSDGSLLIPINAIGCTIESLYIIMFLVYAPKSVRFSTIKMLFMVNVALYGTILLSTYYLIHKQSTRLAALGWICSVFSVCVFAAPLMIMRRVIRTKSVEYLPFSLSCCLTLCAVMWFFYGLLLKDYYVALPNVLGFTFGLAQMLLYFIYRNAKQDVVPVPEVALNVVDLTKLDMEKDKNKKEAEIRDGAEPTVVIVRPSETNV
ncbi:hypothetical protein MKW94_023286 [Papaver nudicaule]|uniref:Bidirectional sugar transporter SWEET n=1 Tax=Papaver nudicaule TaxID=74823 RepID=A0AA41W2Q2_PAPNU|nr:hypothetical protein [Papaver nudicaule]MCL7051775.1 hypothetical protein [Papaver nudicaule]